MRTGCRKEKEVLLAGFCLGIAAAAGGFFIPGAMAEQPAALSGLQEEAKRAVRVRDYPLAVKWLNDLMLKGDVDAGYQLGAFYQTGKGVPIDPEKAFDCFSKAARQGHVKAQYSLGMMFENGQGVAQDNQKAAEWYRRAAEGRYAPALEKLAKFKGAGGLAGRNLDLPKEELLLAAIRDNNPADIEQILAGAPNINYRDRYGHSALMEACERDQLELARRMIGLGADPDARSQDGDSALLRSARKRNMAAVTLLLDGRADINAADVQGMTPLMLAVRNNDVMMVRLLIDRKADPMKFNAEHQDALAIAAARKYEEVRLLLLATGKVAMPAEDKNPEILNAAVRKLSAMKAPDKGAPFERWTPLMLAAWRGETAAVAVLVAQGGDVNAVSEDGHTALSRAAWRGEEKIVDLLLKAGARLEITDGPLPVSPFFLAAENGHVIVVSRLLKALRGDGRDHSRLLTQALSAAIKGGHGAVAMVLLDAGAALGPGADPAVSPLFLASARGDVSLIRIFLERGADINGVDGAGRTPLMIAAESGQVPALRYLLEQQAEIDRQNKEGHSALSFAARAGKAEAAALLIAAGSRINGVSVQGNTPLMLAVDAGAGDVVALLVKNKAGLEPVNKAGDAALTMAVRRDDRETAGILLDHGANPYLACKIVDNASREMRRLLDQHKNLWKLFLKLF